MVLLVMPLYHSIREQTKILTINKLPHRHLNKPILLGTISSRGQRLEHINVRASREESDTWNYSVFLYKKTDKEESHNGMA